MKRLGAAAIALLSCAHEKPPPQTGANAARADATPAAAQAPERKPAEPSRAPRSEGAAAQAPQLRLAPGPMGLLALPANDKAIVNVQLRFRTGAVDDPEGKAGLTYLTARVMTEGGTEKLDAKALLNALFPLAADLDVRVDKEQTTFFTRVHRDHLAKLMPILQDVVLHPRWDPAEFRRLRDVAVNDVEKRLRQGDDENLGKESLYELMYRGHPYGRLTLGHVRDLKSLALEDLKAHAARVFTADRLTVGLSGGYPNALSEQLVSALSAVPTKGASRRDVPSQDPRGPRFLLVEKSADATAISLGMPWGLSRKDADWAALSIARSIFGEHRQFSGRLFRRLREARGLNYGDYAYLEHFQQEGGDAATAQLGRARSQQAFTLWIRPVRDENRLFALRAALFELQRSLSDEPFTAAEVEQTKGFLDGYLLLFDQTDARKLGYALDDAFYGMGGFLQSWRSSIQPVTANQVNAAWRKWVVPGKLQIVLAGRDMAKARRIIVANEPTPIAYQKDAEGNAPQKPSAQLEDDRRIEKFPFGARGADDVELVPVEKLFE